MLLHLSVLTDWEEGQRVLDMENDITLSKAQKRALETVVPENESSFKATAVSSADGAKVIKNIEELARKYEEKSNRPLYLE